LAAIAVASDLEREMHRWVQEELRDRWREVRAAVERLCAQKQQSLDAELVPVERCLSPSDFGFHNALRQADGMLRFFDFEYAGWDDPAKLICDVACQPEVPVPRSLWEDFRSQVLAVLPHAEWIAWRVAWLLPVHQLKWCCLVLNEFLPDGRSRRRFSTAHTRAERQPDVQLAKARRMLECVQLPVE
jgi:hypothetical protein